MTIVVRETEKITTVTRNIGEAAPGGVANHNDLNGRDVANVHPHTSITGLQFGGSGNLYLDDTGQYTTPAGGGGGGTRYRGVWNASTNTPTLPAGDEQNGDFYVVNVAGSTALPGAPGPWNVGDEALFNGTDWDQVPAFQLVIDVFGRTGQVVAQTDDYALAQITGLKDSGLGDQFLADDGTYKTTPAAPVQSVFGRGGAVVAQIGDYALNQITGLVDNGNGTQFLSDDGTYKSVGTQPTINLGRWGWRTASTGLIVPCAQIHTNNAAPASTTQLELSAYNAGGNDMHEYLLDLKQGDQLRLSARNLNAVYELTEAPTDNTEYFTMQNLTHISSTGAAWDVWTSFTLFHMPS